MTDMLRGGDLLIAPVTNDQRYRAALRCALACEDHIPDAAEFLIQLGLVDYIPNDEGRLVPVRDGEGRAWWPR